MMSNRALRQIDRGDVSILIRKITAIGYEYRARFGKRVLVASEEVTTRKKKRRIQEAGVSCSLKKEWSISSSIVNGNAHSYVPARHGLKSGGFVDGIERHYPRQTIRQCVLGAGESRPPMDKGGPCPIREGCAFHQRSQTEGPCG